MKTWKWVLIIGLILALTTPVIAKNGPPDNGGDIPDTGELYGDLYVILRNEGGVPMLDSNGCVQPISTVTATDSVSGISAVEGEPFVLWTYIDSEGDLVECELTETMTTWVETVDFGRLNLGRAPEEVLAHSFDEAIKAMNNAVSISTDPVGRLVIVNGDGVVKTIDSPLENIALYVKMMRDGHWITEDTTAITHGGPPDSKGPPEGDGPSTEPRPVLSDSAIALLPLPYQSLGDASRTNLDLTNDQLLLAASLLAAGADKTGNITLDKVVYLNSIYGINQLGTLPGEVEGKTYFDFAAYAYDRNVFAGRSSGECAIGWVWVLQPDLDDFGVEIPNHFEAQCMEILAYENSGHDPAINAVHFTDMTEAYATYNLTYDFVDNVRAFAQASDDALQMLEYMHNYSVPEVLYP